MKILKMVRSTGREVGLSLGANFVARLLAAVMPDKAKDLLEKPEDLMGFKIPFDLGEFGTTVGGGIAGFTIAEILGRFFPGIPINKLDDIVRFCTSVGEELDDIFDIQRLRGSQTSSSSPHTGRGAERIPMYSTYASLASDPQHLLLVDCSYFLAVTAPVEKVVGRTPKGDPIKKSVDVPLTRFTSFTNVYAAVKAGATAASHGAGCTCASRLQADIDAFEAAQKAPAAASASKPEARPSFAELEYQVVGEATLNKDTALLTAIAELAVMLGLFDEDEKHGLRYCNSKGEYITLARNASGITALVAAGNKTAIDAKKAEFSTHLHHLRNNEEVGRLEGLLGAAASLAAPVRRVVRKEPGRIAKSNDEAQKLNDVLARRAAVSQYAKGKGTSITAVQTCFVEAYGQPCDLDDVTVAMVDQAIAANPQLVNKNTKPRGWFARALRRVVLLPLCLF